MPGRSAHLRWRTPRKSHHSQGGRANRTPTTRTRAATVPPAGGARASSETLARQRGESATFPSPLRRAALGNRAPAPQAGGGEAPAPHHRRDEEARRLARPPGARHPRVEQGPARAGRGTPREALSAPRRAPTRRARMGGAPDARGRGPPRQGRTGNGRAQGGTAVPPSAERGRRNSRPLRGGPRTPVPPPRAPLATTTKVGKARRVPQGRRSRGGERQASARPLLRRGNRGGMRGLPAPLADAPGAVKTRAKAAPGESQPAARPHPPPRRSQRLAQPGPRGPAQPPPGPGKGTRLGGVVPHAATSPRVRTGPQEGGKGRQRKSRRSGRAVPPAATNPGAGTGPREGER